MSDEQKQGEVLIFERSPYGNLDAIVEQDGRTVYFYLNGGEGFGTKACWVANLIRGPLEFNQQDLQFGQPPLLPRPLCIDPNPAKLPDPAAMEIVWFEEGNAAALLIDGKAAAVIPPWSGEAGFHGYAANCAAENIVCWPLPNADEIGRRISQARDFWKWWQHSNPLADYRNSIIVYCEKTFGPLAGSYSVADSGFPPLMVNHFRCSDDSRYLVSTGMALCPQAAPSRDDLPPNYFPHVELVLRLPKELANEGMIQRFATRIGFLGIAQRRQCSWFGASHTLVLEKNVNNFQFGLIIERNLTPDSEAPVFIDARGKPVRVRLLSIAGMNPAEFELYQAGSLNEESFAERI